ncbi:hypothetical protein CkaCkLH20_05090 [Colletotrichum karsti]|uniref:Duf1665 domain containing protein n=1 Tax=Colletotrichum karsti TaxID=1095194 RepID=A0A9P6IEU6_9PEZI|nr:uncharacterized protein CkaCkLH20_05090 [Colletotrichum karsti]KAF9877390.1 hypothetical protein CkaCkLH20_05090 [Colletotrichum karsti]
MSLEWVTERPGERKEEPATCSNDFHMPDDGEVNRLLRPGFGLKLNAMPDIMFPSAVLDWSAITLTYEELAMMWFIEQITNKPDWHVKVFNEEIIAKWRNEVMAVDWAAVDLKWARFTDAVFECCIKELQMKAKLCEETGMVPVFDASEAVIKSDSAITADIKAELKKAVAALEDVPEEDKDWHPGSDGKVLDLVHPSLWPLAYGVSRVLPDKRIPLADTLKFCGSGEVVAEPEPFSVLWSNKFQWLPCEVELSADGKPRIASYINNLHPEKHPDLYAVIEKVIGKALPMWDVLYNWPEKYELQRIEVGAVENRPQEPDENPREEDNHNSDWWEDSDDEPDTEIARRDKIWFKLTHPVRRPEVSPHEYSDLTSKDVKESGFFDDAKRVQVIVKLANIHLTPGKPTYDGGSWHIEGQLNEHICATALYYYDNENITESRLAFRTTTNKEENMSDISYEQDDHYSIGRTFKINPSGDTNQDLGSVLTREDRLIAFPNVYQHCVAPFELVDKTKPGHRKILALFLVEPAIPIISTANVPPQQKHWWRDGMNGGRLPPELMDMVWDNLDIPISLEKAKEMRLDVMKERTAIGEANMDRVSSDRFNFCEH